MRIWMRVAALAAGATAALWAGANLRGQGKNLFWRDGKVTVRVSRIVHMPEGVGAGVDARETAAEVHAAVFQAIRAWARTGRARIELDLDFTDAQTVTAGENVVTFTDTTPYDTGLCDKERFVSCTVASFGEDGAMQSAVVAFNPYKQLSAVGREGAHDIGLLMLHEMGHVLGLDHSYVADSVMLTAAEQEAADGGPRQFAVRELSEDDIYTLAALYPDEHAPLGRITGRVTREGTPVQGVRVLALSTLGRVPFGAVSGEDGSYALHLPKGDYTVVADAPDGPGGVAGSGAVKIADEGTETAGADVALPPPGARLVVDTVGVVQNGAYAGMPRVDLARGRDHNLALTRAPELGALELILPEPAVLRLGNASSPVSAPQLVRQNVRVDAQAPTGSYAFAVRAGLNFAVLPARLRIVNNPRVEAVRDFETGEPVTLLRAGRRYVLTGVDLAAGAAAQAEPEFEGAPLPVQLGGVALRLGGRWAPLLTVKPEEIVFDAPDMGEAAEVSLAVVAGSLMESAALKLAAARE
ncbi:MAG: matrixin family metalloprotease [Bryobacterales bacterium]|nr:matrixin family metalloprotease [Bryobacterales bacterium]